MPESVAGRFVRLLHCVDSFHIGGTELNAIRTVEALDRDRFHVEVACLNADGPLIGRYEALGVPIRHFPIGPLYSSRTVAQGLRFGRFVRQREYDVVHTHDIYTNVFCAPYARQLTGSGVVASRRWSHDTPRRGLATLNKWSYRFAHRVLANSPSLVALLTTEERISPDKVSLIPNFLEERAFAPLDASRRRQQLCEWGVPERAFVVGSVARLAPVKNHKLLLMAARTLPPDVHIVLVGDGPMRNELDLLAHKLQIADRIHFAGSILRNENLHAYFDVSALCSFNEGFPNTVIEAMAAGIAVVTTDVSGIPALYGGNEAGVAIPSDDPGALASAILRLRDSTEFRRSLGQRGRQMARDGYHVDQVLRTLARLYCDLVRQRQRGPHARYDR